MSQNSTLLYTSGHTEWYIVQLLATVPMLVLLCTACWSVQGRVYRLRSAPSLEKGWSLSQRVLTHDETQHTAGEKETEQERERESESSHPSPPPPPPSSLLPPFPPCLPLTPHTPTRSGPRRHLWWAAASCWSRGRSSGRRARGPPRCGWPGPGAGPGAVGPSSRRRCASIRCIAAGRTLRRWRRTAAPGPGWSPRLSTATSAQRSAPRPGTVSERTSGGRERGREGEKRWRGKKKRVNINCIHAKQRSRGLWSEGKRGGGQRVMEPEEEWELSKHTRLTDNPLQQTSQTDDHEKKFSPENKSLCFPHTHTHTHTTSGVQELYTKTIPVKIALFFFLSRLHVTASLTKLPTLIHQRTSTSRLIREAPGSSLYLWCPAEVLSRCTSTQNTNFLWHFQTELKKKKKAIKLHKLSDSAANNFHSSNTYRQLCRTSAII